MSTAQWANIGDDPGALHALVERLPEHVPIPTIDYLWLFPARRIATGESIVVVIAAFDEDPDRRRVSTAHFTVARNRRGAATVNARFDEHGSAPVTAVPRIVQGVLRRLGEDTEASPREEQVGGERDQWNALIVELGGRPRTPEVAPGDTAAEAAEPHVELEAAATEAPEPGGELEAAALEGAEAGGELDATSIGKGADVPGQDGEVHAGSPEAGAEREGASAPVHEREPDLEAEAGTRHGAV